jgi:hypothetical protein
MPGHEAAVQLRKLTGSAEVGQRRSTRCRSSRGRSGFPRAFQPGQLPVITRVVPRAARFSVISSRIWAGEAPVPAAMVLATCPRRSLEELAARDVAADGDRLAQLVAATRPPAAGLGLDPPPNRLDQGSLSSATEGGTSAGAKQPADGGGPSATVASTPVSGPSRPHRSLESRRSSLPVQWRPEPDLRSPAVAFAWVRSGLSKNVVAGSSRVAWPRYIARSGVAQEGTRAPAPGDVAKAMADASRCRPLRGRLPEPAR